MTRTRGDVKIVLKLLKASSCSCSRFHSLMFFGFAFYCPHIIEAFQFFFRTRTTFEHHGYLDFRITPLDNSSSICFLTSSIIAGDIFLCFCLKGVGSIKSILCLIISQSPLSASCIENTSMCFLRRDSFLPFCSCVRLESI